MLSVVEVFLLDVSTTVDMTTMLKCHFSGKPSTTRQSGAKILYDTAV